MAKKKQKIIRFKIPCPSWGCAVWVQIGGKRHEAAKYFGKLMHCTFDPNQESQAIGTTFCPDIFRDACIWFSEIPGGKLASHEAFHAVHHILSSAGIKLSGDSEEAYAYLIDYIIGEIGQKVW